MYDDIWIEGKRDQPIVCGILWQHAERMQRRQPNTNRYPSDLRKGEKHEEIKKTKHSNDLNATSIPNSAITDISVCD